MSLNLSKGPIWAIAGVVALIAATGLVAGYVDRPGTCPKTASVSAGDCAACPASGDCADCPVKGTEACPKEAGTCPKAACSGEAAGASCPVGATVMAQPAAEAGATCPMKAAAAQSQCGAGQCPASK